MYLSDVASGDEDACMQLSGDQDACMQLIETQHKSLGEFAAAHGTSDITTYITIRKSAAAIMHRAYVCSSPCVQRWQSARARLPSRTMYVQARMLRMPAGYSA